MELLGDVGEVEARFSPFGISVNLSWEEHTVARKSLWAHLMELLGVVGHIEAHFGSFGDKVNLSVRLLYGLR
jgi:hypothetical protein